MRQHLPRLGKYSPDLPTFANLFCSESPDSPTFANLFCSDSPDSPTFAKGHFWKKCDSPRYICTSNERVTRIWGEWPLLSFTSIVSIAFIHFYWIFWKSHNSFSPFWDEKLWRRLSRDSSSDGVPDDDRREQKRDQQLRDHSGSLFGQRHYSAGSNRSTWYNFSFFTSYRNEA